MKKTVMADMKSCRGWLITIVTFVHFFANYGFLYSYGQFSVVFQEEFGKGATITGWLGTIPFGLTYLASPISIALIARYQHRLIAAIGVIACFTSLIVTSFMTSLLPMFFTFSLLYGLGINFVTVSGLNIILKYFPDKNSARAVTIALLGCNAGLLALNPPIYFMIKSLGWRNALRIASAAVIATGVGAVSVFTRPPQRNAEREMKYTQIKTALNTEDDEKQYSDKMPGDELVNNKGFKEEMTGDDVSSNSPPEKMKVHEDNHCGDEFRSRAVLKYPELWLLATAMVVCSAAVCFFYMSLVNFLRSKKFDGGTSAMIMTALGVSQVIGKIVVALIGDHLPFPKIFSLVIANIIGAVQMGCLLIAQSLIPTVSIIAISGLLVISVLDTIPHAVSHQIFHSNQCLVSWTIITSSMGSGYVIGAMLGESIDQTGSYDSALYVCMGFFLLSALLCTMVPLYQRCCASDRIIKRGTEKMNHPEEVC